MWQTLPWLCHGLFLPRAAFPALGTNTELTPTAAGFQSLVLFPPHFEYSLFLLNMQLNIFSFELLVLVFWIL